MNLKNRQPLFFILVGFLLTQPVESFSQPKEKSPQLSKVEIIGNKNFSSRKIKEWLDLKKKQPTSQEIVQERCKSLLAKIQSEGYYFSKIDSINFNYNTDSSRVALILFLQEGSVPKVKDFIIQGLEDRKIISRLRTRKGREFYSDVLEIDIAEIMDYYENTGYPFCEVKITKFKMNENADSAELSLTLEVNSGKEIRIDEIKILGNEETKPYVILRELPFASGEIYEQRKMDKIPSILLNTGFFKWVNEPYIEVEQTTNRNRLIIELAEKNHNQFDGVVGYNPGSANTKGFVTGLLDFRFGNLFGTGRQIDAFWERRSQDTQELKFGYTEPWLGGFPLSVGFGFEQIIQDTSYIQREVALDLRYAINSNVAITTGISNRSISPDSLGALLFNVSRSTALNLRVGAAFNTLSDPINPESGVRYFTGFEWSRKTFDDTLSGASSPGSFNLKRLSVDFENYFSLFRWQVLALGLHGREVTSDEAVISITDMYRFGGTKSMRGYREEQFRGSRIAWGNLEYRYLIGGPSRLFAFLDFGYYFREEILNSNKLKTDDFKIGYGFGMRIDTKLGYFGLDYGLGEGDSFSNGKIHIRLVNEF